MDNRSWIIKIVSITVSIVVIIILLKALGVIGKEQPQISPVERYINEVNRQSGTCPYAFSDIGGGYCRDVNGTVVPKR
jgi:hypothetical protein